MPEQVLYRVSIGEIPDPVMVATYIDMFELNHVQVGPTEPYRNRAEGSTLFVDTYPWGRVCVARNRYGDHVTWIEHGEVPPAVPMWTWRGWLSDGRLQVRTDSECGRKA